MSGTAYYLAVSISIAFPLIAYDGATCASKNQQCAISQAHAHKQPNSVPSSRLTCAQYHCTA